MFGVIAVYSDRRAPSTVLVGGQGHLDTSEADAVSFAQALRNAGIYAAAIYVAA